MGNTETNIWEHPVMDDDIKEAWKKLSVYVEKSCEGRDDSHGHAHMEKVATDTVKIIINEARCNCPCFRLAVYVSMIIAWLHDVCDHKYDPEGKLKDDMKQFLADELKLDNKFITAITRAIDSISFSKENKMRQNGMSISEIEEQWKKNMGSDTVRYRNIVSDADKLSALGKDGLERCIQYTKEIYRKTHNVDMPYVELVADVIQHSKDKLLRLKKEFIRTDTGKKMAEQLHLELIDGLVELVAGLKEK